MNAEEQVQITPCFQVSLHGTLAHRQGADNRLNPRNAVEMLLGLPLNEGLLGDPCPGISGLDGVVHAPFRASFNPLPALLEREPPVGASRPSVERCHVSKMWNAINTKANQIRSNHLIRHYSLFLYRTEGSNPSLSESFCHNNLGKQAKVCVKGRLILTGYDKTFFVIPSCAGLS